MFDYCGNTSFSWSDPGASLSTLFCELLTPIDGGFSRILPYALHLLKILAAFELTVAAIWWSFGKEEVIESFLKQIIKISFFILLVANFQPLMSTILESFITAGVVIGNAGGGGISDQVNTVTNPGALLTKGFNLAFKIVGFNKDILEYNLQDATPSPSWLFGWLEPIIKPIVMAVNFFQYLPYIFILVVCFIVLIVVYTLIAIKIFIAFLEFYILSALSVILLPFAVFKHTEFISKQLFPTLISAGVKLMTISFVLAIFYNLSNIPSSVFYGVYNISFNGPKNVALSAILIVLITFLMVLVLQEAPKLASSLVGGSPDLSSRANAAAGATQVAGAIGSGTMRASKTTAGYAATGAKKTASAAYSGGKRAASAAYSGGKKAAKSIKSGARSLGSSISNMAHRSSNSASSSSSTPKRPRADANADTTRSSISSDKFTPSGAKSTSHMPSKSVDSGSFRRRANSI